MWEIFFQGHILSTIGDALQEQLVGDVSSSSLAFGCVGGGVGSPHWVQRKKGVMGSYGDGHHITESTHSWSFLEVLKSAQGLAKKLLGVFFALFCFWVDFVLFFRFGWWRFFGYCSFVFKRVQGRAWKLSRVDDSLLCLSNVREGRKLLKWVLVSRGCSS